jgi:hypothetical protein
MMLRQLLQCSIAMTFYLVVLPLYCCYYRCYYARRLVISNLAGERRFGAAVGKRMESLGAITQVVLLV